MTTNYQKGTIFEYAIREHLRSEGYDVFRTAGSHGTVDLIAIKPGQLLLVQAKTNGVIGPFARQALTQLANCIDGALPIVAWKKRGTSRPQYVQLTGTRTTDKVPFTTDELA
jgi:Holliday junction resolvase